MAIIVVAGIFLGFSLGFATMALMSARNYRLQCEEAQETSRELASGLSPIRRFTTPHPARPQATGASCVLAP